MATITHTKIFAQFLTLLHPQLKIDFNYKYIFKKIFSVRLLTARSLLAKPIHCVYYFQKVYHVERDHRGSILLELISTVSFLQIKITIEK